jgi:N-methylhydantoinase B/oxoprolinase/acetone carboxylase alpha subunit
MPETMMGDFTAQVAADRIATRRLVEAAERYGADKLTALFEVLLDRSERMTREALRRLPEGTYTYEDFLDNDGIELDKKISIKVAVTVKDGAVTFDFAGTSPQVKGPLNIVPSGVHSSAYYGIRAITDPAIPTNGGCFRPVTVKLEKGSLVDPYEPAPVNGRTATMKRIASCIVGALAQVVPERFPAAAAATVLVLKFSGRREDGSRYVQGDLVNGGTGASRGLDGVDAIATDMTNGSNMAAEVMELNSPVRLVRSELRPGSGGDGTWRGGLGVVREYEVLAGPAALGHRGERHFVAPAGLLGGGPGAKSHSEIRRADGRIEIVQSKTETVLQTGDRLYVMTPGGGGYGAPASREAAMREADALDGKA